MPENELPKYQPDMFAAPEKECDVVMKGGITSGVVYPYAVLELARRYRFRSIGGTSAG
ncbi:patatin, partial [Agrobacterium tumefaciens str. Cherry 2E-2-2]